MPLSVDPTNMGKLDSVLTWKRIVVLMLTCLAALPSHGTEDGEPVLWSFVPGRYQFIGRHPDSLRTYSGTATIERVGNKLRLTRSIAGKRSQVLGVVRRADPGEADVLAFKWGNRTPMEMVCLVGSDLDNYPRLTCHWGKKGNPHTQPGLEAYFALEPWDPVKP